MYCQKCGATIPDNSAFCTECGATQNLAAQPIYAIPQTKAKKSVFKKWWFWVIVAIAAIIIIASLGGKDKEGSTPSAGTSPTTTEEGTTNSAASDQTGTGNLGDYSVSITGYTLTTDYEGKPAVVITYEWTNNSDEAASFAFALTAQVFQNDIECDIAIVMDNDVYNANNYMKDIKPGATLSVQLAYVLQDSASPITVEVSELISFSEDKVAQTFDITK